MDALFHRLQLKTYASHTSKGCTLFDMFCVGFHTVLFCSAYQLNSKFQTFYSSQEGVTGTRDSPHMKSQEVSEIYKTLFLNILKICQRRTVISRRWKKLTRWALPLLQLTSLREFPGHCAKRENPGGVHWTLWVGTTELKIWKSQCS